MIRHDDSETISDDHVYRCFPLSLEFDIAGFVDAVAVAVAARLAVGVSADVAVAPNHLEIHPPANPF